MRLVLAGVLVVSVLAFILAAFMPYGPSAVYPVERLVGDASAGRIEKIEEGQNYTQVFLTNGERYYIASMHNYFSEDPLGAALRAATGSPPPVIEVNDTRTPMLILLMFVVSAAGVLVSGVALVWDLVRGRKRRKSLAVGGLSP